MRAGYGKGISAVIAALFGVPLMWAAASVIPVVGLYIKIILGLIVCFMLVALPIFVSEFFRQRNRAKRNAALELKSPPPPRHRPRR